MKRDKYNRIVRKEATRGDTLASWRLSEMSYQDIHFCVCLVVVNHRFAFDTSRTETLLTKHQRQRMRRAVIRKSRGL